MERFAPRGDHAGILRYAPFVPLDKQDEWRGWEAEFTQNFIALLITCQVISYVVMIRTVCAWGVS
jgi:hypothetical protein